MADKDELLRDPHNFCFIDSETRSLPGSGIYGDLKACGVDAYAPHAKAIMWTYCIGKGDVQIMALDDGFDESLTWDLDASDELKDFHERAKRGEAWYVAWNMGFDRAVWNNDDSDFPVMEIDMSLDAMVQAACSSLPGKLEHAARAMGLGGKLEEGQGLIQLFCPAGGPQPSDEPQLWDLFKEYGIRDTALLRDVFLRTRMLPYSEWEDYHVSERINQRGVALDIDFAQRAAAVAAANLNRINSDLVVRTNGEVEKVTQIARLTAWVYDKVAHAEAREIMVKKWEPEGDDEDGDLVAAKVSLDKERLEKMINFYQSLPELTDFEKDLLAALEHRFYGGSTSPAKFSKMLNMHRGGVLRGQYTCNGAPQTGRFSSRGVQIHNLMRQSLGSKEEEFMELINEVEI